MKKIAIKKNRYVDSVTLMSVGDKVLKLDGIESADAQMATPANREVLEGLGFVLPPDAGPDDLVLAVTARTESQADKAFSLMEDILNHRLPSEEDISYRSLGEINLKADPYDMVQISLPGEYVYDEAEKALNMGLNVFIFSDNVPLGKERALKERAQEKHLLVMGPDCGVGFVHGVCLGAGSVMGRGSVGIVAASGSGAQEIGCILEKCGLGVSEIIGTGGRDLYPEIGGMAMLDGMRRLEQDDSTRVIILVSKFADLTVMEKVLRSADRLQKPVVAVFLGASRRLFESHRVHAAFSLEEGALAASELAGVPAGHIVFSDEQIAETVSAEMALYHPGQKYFRGLYCGGTFTEEGLIYFSQHVGGITLYSNLSTPYARKLPDHHKSIGHAILDLGAEDFTAEAPHPVFDPSLRVRRLKKELADPEVAVILMDFITGPGVAEDPFTSVIEVIRQSEAAYGRHVTFIANICGSRLDPQNIAAQEKKLQEAGAIVAVCNYESARLAGALMTALEKRGVMA